MLIKTSKESIKTALEHLVKLPFAKDVIHRLTESARGKYIVFFSIHRVLDDSKKSLAHPHFINRTALTLNQAVKQITHINRRVPFISMIDAVEFLLGKKILLHSHAVLVIEVPYVDTVKLLLPRLEDLKIPVVFAINTQSIEDGQSPWMDDIVYRLGLTDKKSLSVNFIDRAFTLNSMAEKMRAAEHLIHYLSQSTPELLRQRLAQMSATLSEIAMNPASESICSVSQLEKLSLNPLVSFICAGKFRLPLVNISLEEAADEIVSARNILNTWLSSNALPIFFHQFAFDKRRYKDLAALMMENGFLAAITQQKGLARPGDNMFRLRKLSLAQGLKSFEQYELQGLSDAIDEFLLVTWAKNKSSGD